ACEPMGCRPLPHPGGRATDRRARHVRALLPHRLWCQGRHLRRHLHGCDPLEQRRQVVRVTNAEMMSHQASQIRVLKAAAIAMVAVTSTAPWTAAQERFQKLTPGQIKARLAGMEITDGVHWAEQYMRDGTFKAFSMGKAAKGKWFVRNGELCLD